MKSLWPLGFLLAGCSPPVPPPRGPDPAVTILRGEHFDYDWHASATLSEVTLPDGTQCVVLDEETANAISCNWRKPGG